MIKWFTPVVALGVAIFILFFLISINSKVELGESQPLTLQSENNTTQTQKMWIDHFSQTQRKGYSYPVNEVYIKVDLDEKITKTITYKLEATVLDPYQTFCLKEELKHHKLKYFLKQDKQGMELLIYSQNVNKLNSLVKVLRNYKISASVKPYKEEY